MNLFSFPEISPHNQPPHQPPFFTILFFIITLIFIFYTQIHCNLFSESPIFIVSWHWPVHVQIRTQLCVSDTSTFVYNISFLIFNFIYVDPIKNRLASLYTCKLAHTWPRESARTYQTTTYLYFLICDHSYTVYTCSVARMERKHSTWTNKLNPIPLLVH